MRETWVWSLGWEDPLEESLAAHSNILTWRIPMGRGAWQAIVHGVVKSRTWLSDWTELNWTVRTNRLIWWDKTIHRLNFWTETSWKRKRKLKVKVKSLSRVWLFVTPWIVAYQASPSPWFSRLKYWSGLPFPSLGDLPHPGIKPGSPTF